MEITTRTVGKCKVLDCNGKLTLGPATFALRKAIHEAVKQDASKVVLNFRNVIHMDTSGLGEIISGYAHVVGHGRKLAFLNFSENLQSMIARVKLLTVFEFSDNEQRALEGCEQVDFKPSKEEQ